jgi:hypothetical protein
VPAARLARVGVGAGAAPPPNPPPRPASGSHRLLHTLGQAGEQYGPSIAPFARARWPYSPDGAARGSHTGQFSCFGSRSCFIAFVLGIPNGFWPLNMAVGRAYIRDMVPSTSSHQPPATSHHQPASHQPPATNPGHCRGLRFQPHPQPQASASAPAAATTSSY